jgi:hypothetical protein
MTNRTAIDDVIDDSISELIDDDTECFVVLTGKSDGEVTKDWYGDGDYGSHPDIIALLAFAVQSYADNVGLPPELVMYSVTGAWDDLFNNEEVTEMDPELTSE